MTPDPLDRLMAYRPSADVVDAEWTPAARARLRTRLLTEAPARARLRFVPRRRTWGVAAPVAAGTIVVALIAGIIVFASGGGGDPGLQPAGPPFTASGVRATPDVGAHQYAYRADKSFDVKDGKLPVETQRTENWAAPDGSIWSYRRSGGKTECNHFRPSGAPTFDGPTKAFFDRLPTDVAVLQAYLRTHVMGSTSRDEAVFVAAGDMLRLHDGLATSRLRASLVAVLSRTPRITVHPDVRDFLGRPAVRADFVDQDNRPGELASLYFDATTFQLLAERNGTSGKPAGPVASRSYDATARPDATAQELTGPATLVVMTVEKVVDALPKKLAKCTVDGG